FPVDLTFAAGAALAGGGRDAVTRAGSRGSAGRSAASNGIAPEASRSTVVAPPFTATRALATWRAPRSTRPPSTATRSGATSGVLLPDPTPTRQAGAPRMVAA